MIIIVTRETVTVGRGIFFPGCLGVLRRMRVAEDAVSEVEYRQVRETVAVQASALHRMAGIHLITVAISAS